MRGRTSITRRVNFPLGDPRTPSQACPHSYFITVAISQLKMRIKIPELLAKIMQNRLHGYNKSITVDDPDDHKPKRMKPRKLLVRRKVFPIFTNVFGCNKSSVREMQAKVFRKNEKKVRFGCTEGEINKSKHDLNICGRHDKGVCVADVKDSSAAMVLRKRACSVKLIKVSSKAVLTQRRWRRVGSLSKALSKAGLELKCIKATKESESLELCKKRILMGIKCKPLNMSGILQYDINGILIPEMLP